jgi:copper oxidase (laccase) domain-containing protein
VVAVADCVPVALTCEGSVAMAHSGWRGTLSASRARLRARLGDLIRPPCGVHRAVHPGVLLRGLGRAGGEVRR